MKRLKIIGIISAICLVIIAIIATLLIIIFNPWKNKNKEIDLGSLGQEDEIIDVKEIEDIPEAFIVRAQYKEDKITYYLYGVNGDFLVYDVSYDKDYSVEDLYKDYESGKLFNMVDVYIQIVNINDLQETVNKYKKAIMGDLELEYWSSEISLCMEYYIKSDCYYGLIYDENHNVQSVLLDAYNNESGSNLKNNKLMYEVINWLENDKELSEVVEEKKDISITSKEDMLNISDEDLIYLVKNINAYKTEDFVKDFTGKAIEDFGIPLDEYTIDDYTAYERFDTDLLSPEVTRSQLDINKQFPKEELQKLIDEFAVSLIESNNGIKDKCQVVYCGETDQYVEYKYVVIEQRRTNGEDWEFPYLSRRIFYKNYFMVESDDGKYAGPLYIGEVTPEKICAMEDFNMANSDGIVLFREVEESEQAVTYIAYVPELEYGDNSEDTKAIISKIEFTIDKETHEEKIVSSVVKSVDLHK